jgi:hypothetical protein
MIAPGWYRTRPGRARALPIVLPIARLKARYARHYLGDAAAGAMFPAPSTPR